MYVKHAWHVEFDGGSPRAMTQDNIDTILDRLNEIQAKNDADHDRVDRRLDAIDRNMERLWQSTNEGFIQVNQKLQDQGRQIKTESASMSKRPDYGDATPEDLARALMRPTNGRQDGSPFSAIRSRYIRRFPTSPAVSGGHLRLRIRVPHVVLPRELVDVALEVLRA